MVNRLVSVGDDFTLPPAVKAADANLPTRLGATALNATILDKVSEDAADPAGLIAQSVAVRPRSSPPLARFRAALALRDTLPVPILFVGSSTTGGTGASTSANRYVNRLMKAIQDAYPLATGYTSPAVSGQTVTLPLANGVQGFNFGWGGARSNNYIDAGMYTKIGQMQPYLVVHMVGSNDYANGVTPAAYKANMLTALGYLRSTITKPAVHVYVHSFVRGDAAAVSGHIAPDTEFRQALIEIVQDNPEDTYFIDLSEEYAAIDVPGTDPLAFLDPDLIHQNDKGHAFMADLLRDKLGIPLVQFHEAIPAPPFVGIVTSDSFGSGSASTLNGRVTDVAAGGTAKTWGTSVANSYAIASGVLVRGADTASSFAYIQEAHNDVEVSFKVTALPSASSQIVARRDITTTGSTSYRLNLRSSGTLQIDKAVAGTVTTITSISTATYAVGDVVKLKCVGSTISAQINGVEALTATDAAIAGGSYAGFSVPAGATIGLDDFLLKNL